MAEDDILMRTTVDRLAQIERELAKAVDDARIIGDGCFASIDLDRSATNNTAIIGLFKEGMKYIEDLVVSNHIDRFRARQLLEPFAELKQRFHDNVVWRNRVGITDILAKRLDSNVCDLIVVKLKEDELDFDPAMDNLQRYQVAEQTALNRFSDLGIHEVTGVPIREATVLWNGNLKQPGISTVWLVVPKKFNIDVAGRLAFEDIEFINLEDQ